MERASFYNYKKTLFIFSLVSFEHCLYRISLSVILVLTLLKSYIQDGFLLCSKWREFLFYHSENLCPLTEIFN